MTPANKCAECGRDRSEHDADGWRFDGGSFPGGHRFRPTPETAIAQARKVIDDVYDGGKSARIRQLIEENDRLRAEIVTLQGRIDRISDEAFGAAPLDVEHEIHSHADTLPHWLRRITKALEAIKAITSEPVSEAEDAFLAEAASRCQCCETCHQQVPCAGVTQGASCDALCTCDRDNDARYEDGHDGDDT